MPRIERPKMAAYGVPDELDGALSWSWAADRLVANRNYWVTTVDGANRPHSMPVWGVWDESSERFWFSCAVEAAKLRWIEGNPNVVIANDDTVEVVSMEGRAQRVAGDDHRVGAIAAAWGAKYGEDAQSVADLAEFFAQGAVIVVEPVKAFGVIERAEDFGPKATRWIW